MITTKMSIALAVVPVGIGWINEINWMAVGGAVVLLLTGAVQVLRIWREAIEIRSAQADEERKEREERRAINLALAGVRTKAPRLKEDNK